MNGNETEVKQLFLILIVIYFPMWIIFRPR